MAVDSYIEIVHQKMTLARVKAEVLREVASRADRTWRDAESDYDSAYAIYAKALMARDKENS